MPTVDVDETIIYYEVAGEGDWVVLLPRLAADHTFWTRMVPTLVGRGWCRHLPVATACSPSTFKAPAVPTNLVRGDVFYWQSLMASAVIVAVPVALAYNFFLDRFVKGFTMGAVKG